MNTKAIGEKSEGIILAALLRNGSSVSLPFGNNQRYDLVLDEGGKLVRAQCKTGRIDRYGSVKFPVRSINGFTGKKRSYLGEADIFLVYCPDNDKIYRVEITPSIPVDYMSLRTRPSKNNQSKGINYAEDFEVKNGL